MNLRVKIILITVLTPLALAAGALVTVKRSVQEHVDSSSIHESLDHSVLVFERTLEVRRAALAGGTEVIASDPRFFSLLMLGVDQRDARFVNTVRGMAKDMNGITQTDVFEVFDRRGRRLASVGAVRSGAELERSLVRQALKGASASGVPIIDGRQFQVCATPVRADGRVVGVLVLGTEIGENLARELRSQMRSEVTFMTPAGITATTLATPGDRDALVAAARKPASTGVFKVNGAEMTFVTVVRPLPGADPASGQAYAMQRAFDPELVFLQEMQRHLWLLALIALVGAVLTGLLLSGSITGPLHQLVRAAHEMQRGNYAHPVRVRSRDEIGYLAERFNEMRQRERIYVSGLEDAARMKTEFIRLASNELRSPISVIAGYCDMFEDGSLGPIEPRQKEALRAIAGCLDRLTHVAEQASEIAEVQRTRADLEPTLQPLRPLVERAIGSAIAAANRDDVRTESRFDDVAIEVDGARIEEAVAVLVGHALRESPADGRVAVEVREVKGGAEIVIEDDVRAADPEDVAVASPAPDADPQAPARIVAGVPLARSIIEGHGGTLATGTGHDGGRQVVVRLVHDREGAQRKAA